MVTIFLLVSFVVMPIQGLQSSSQNISSYGLVSYSSSMRWLRTDGKWIVDDEGNVVILRGANFMGYEFGFWDSHMEEDYAKMASWGFNVVRLPMAWSYIEPTPGVYNSSYFDYIDKDIKLAEKYGLYIILDLHQYKWSTYFGGNGLPMWAVGSYENSEKGMGQAITDFWTGKGPNGTDANANNSPMKERLVNIWRYIAQRYANTSAIAAYELFNEPPDSSQYMDNGLDSSKTAEYLYPLYSRIIEEIRSVDPNHIIVYEPVGGWGSRTARKLDYPNLAYSFHFYWHEPYSGNITELEEAFLYRFQYIEPTLNPCVGKMPIWLGEVGIDYPDSKNPNASMWVKDILSLCDKYEITWQWWTMWKRDTGKALLYTNGTEKEIIRYLRLH